MDVDCCQRIQQWLDVDAGRAEQGVGEGAVTKRAIELSSAARKDGAHQGIAIGMDAARGEAQQHVAGLHFSAVDEALALHRADAEAGEIIVSGGVHARHFGGFAAEQRTTRLLATTCDAIHHRRAGLDAERTGCEVVEKQQRLGALHHHVVDAHRDQIDADAVMTSGFDGEQQLGADAIGARHQDRIAITAGTQIKQSSKATEPTEHATAMGRAGSGADASDQLFAGLDIDAGGAIGQALLLLAVLVGAHGAAW